MRWPWSKQIEEAHEEATRAQRAASQAAARKIEVEQEMVQVRKEARVLRSELEANGFTELLRQAMGGAAT